MRRIGTVIVTVATAIHVAAFSTENGNLNEGNETNGPAVNANALPAGVGDLKFTKSIPTLRAGIALGSDNTVYVIAAPIGMEPELLRVSKPGVVQELIMYRGWPYILDRWGRIYAFDMSAKTSILNKMPYIAIRSVRTAPLAFGAGIGLYVLAFINQSFFGLSLLQGFNQPSAIADGMALFYGVDWTKTILFTTPRQINRGGNFFKKLVAKDVTQIVEDQEYDDYRVTITTRRQTSEKYLSLLAPVNRGAVDCAEYLTKMSMR